MRIIEREIDIDATPAQVWAVLTDFPEHKNWNPFITDITGQGERLHAQELGQGDP